MLFFDSFFANCSKGRLTFSLSLLIFSYDQNSSSRRTLPMILHLPSILSLTLYDYPMEFFHLLFYSWSNSMSHLSFICEENFVSGLFWYFFSTQAHFLFLVLPVRKFFVSENGCRKFLPQVLFEDYTFRPLLFHAFFCRS